MKDWNRLKVGDKITFHWDEFDGSGSLHGRVAEVHADYVIVRIDGHGYWLDDDTQDMFCRGWVQEGVRK